MRAAAAAAATPAIATIARRARWVCFDDISFSFSSSWQRSDHHERSAGLVAGDSRRVLDAEVRVLARRANLPDRCERDLQVAELRRTTADIGTGDRHPHRSGIGHLHHEITLERCG